MGGTSSTHVANAYRRPIYVRADAERKYLTEDSSSYSGGVEVADVGGVSGSGSRSRKWDWNKIRAGFTRINPGHYVRFDVDLSGKDTVYITAITTDGILVANALPKRKDLSVIIGANAQIYDTKHGSVWKDSHGRYHPLRQGRGKRALEGNSLSGMHPMNQNFMNVTMPSQLGHGATKSSEYTTGVPMAAIGICLIVLLAGLAVIGIKRLRGQSKASKGRRERGMKPDSDGSEYVKFDAPVPTELQLSDGSGCSDDSANSDQTVTNERCYDKTPEYVYGLDFTSEVYQGESRKTENFSYI